MPAETPGINPHQEAMNQQFDAARAATMASGQYDSSRYFDQGRGQIETMRTADVTGSGIDSAHLKVDTRTNGYERKDATVFKTTPQGSVEYHSYNVQDPGSYVDKEHGAVHVTRRDQSGEVVSERRLTNPDTVRKFGKLIAKQVTQRAEAAQNERRAA